MGVFEIWKHVSSSSSAARSTDWLHWQWHGIAYIFICFKGGRLIKDIIELEWSNEHKKCIGVRAQVKAASVRLSKYFRSAGLPMPEFGTDRVSRTEE